MGYKGQESDEKMANEGKGHAKGERWNKDVEKRHSPNVEGGSPRRGGSPEIGAVGATRAPGLIRKHAPKGHGPE